MKASIREFEPSDEEPVVGPSLRAWVAEAALPLRWLATAVWGRFT